MHTLVKALASRAPWTRTIDILLRDTRTGAYATNIIFSEIPSHEIVEPTFSLTYENGQVLMDELWAAGLRPTEGSGSAGALAATQVHLEDMRGLVTKLLSKVLE